MSQIRISPEMMRSRSNQYVSYNQELMQLMSQLDNLLMQLNEEWEGAAAAGFENQWQQIRPSFTNCSNMLESISIQLNQTASAMEELDINISNQMQ